MVIQYRSIHNRKISCEDHPATSRISPIAYIMAMVFVVSTSAAFSQNPHLANHLENSTGAFENVPSHTKICEENINFEKLHEPLIVAIINGINVETGIVEIEIVNKLIKGNILTQLFGSDFHQDLAGIVHTYSEHFSASFQILVDSQTISASDEDALQRLEIINSYYNRRLKILIHQLITDTNFGQDRSSLEVWKHQANKVLDGLFDVWSDYLSYH